MNEIIAKRIVVIIRDESESFTHLASLGKLDPAKSFRGANLCRVDFGFDDLTGFQFDGANLSGANLYNARNLHPSMFKNIITDEKTRWPDGFDFDMWHSTAELSKEDEIYYDIKTSTSFKTEWNGDFYWDLHNKGNYNAALDYCMAVRRNNPDEVGANIFEAHILGGHLGRVDEGIKLLSNAIDRTPGEPNFHFFMAEMLAIKHDFIGAEVELRKTLDFLGEKDTDSRARVLLKIAEVVLDSKERQDDAQFEMAQQTIQKAEKLNITNTNILEKIKDAKIRLRRHIARKKSWWRNILKIITG